jgi:hypothetical protein
LTSDEDTRRVADSVGNNDLLDLVAKSILDGLAQIFKLLLVLFTLLLLVLGLLELETFLRHGDEFLVLKLLQLRDGVFIDGVNEQEDFKALLLEDFKEWRVFDGGEGFTSEVVDGFLDFGHASDVILQGGLLLDAFGRVEAKEFSELAAVLRIFVNTELEVLAECLVKLGKVVLVLGDFAEDLHALFDNVLADDLEDLVLLEGFTRDVEREIFRVDDTLDEVEVLGDKILAIVHDEHAADIEFDVISLLFGLEEIERSTALRQHRGRRAMDEMKLTAWAHRE